MKFTDKLPYLIVAGLIWIVIISSCANQGMPTGGPRDSIPPDLVGTYPKYQAVNFSGDEVRLTFNEYILPDQVREKLVVSPPLEKRPTIQTKSKTLIVKFNEDLRDSATYSLDFKNSVVDNNERNEYENLRFSFSTGDVYDSLRVAGRVIDAFNLEPKENVLVMLHKNLHDSAVYTTIPNYIAKTDEEGYFLMDNIARGTYHIFSITDNNNNLKYNEGAEEIAFADTVVVPWAEFVDVQDTLVKGADSLLIAGHTQFHPDPFYLRQFTEDIFDQYLEKYERQNKYQATFVFNESVNDTFSIKLLNQGTEEDRYLMEYDENMDSLTIWFADTLTANIDTIIAELSYYQLDSMNQVYVQKDTVELSFKEKVSDTKRKKKAREKEEDEEEPIEQFIWQTNLGSARFDLNKDLIITSPEPLKTLDTTQIKLFYKEDTLQVPLKFSFEKDTAEWRTYRLKYSWEPETEYTLKIDSAASENIYGTTSKELLKNFETREEDYYGSIILNVTKVNDPVIFQLLKNNDTEEVIKQKIIEQDEELVFDFLPPEKYKVKAIYDRNGNGKWDTGSYQDKYLPERVAYINEVIKVRSNWENKYNWEMIADPEFSKNIRDKELEEQMRKEAQEKARQERENPGRPQNSGFQQNSGTPGSNILQR